jgi:hypothetical protein
MATLTETRRAQRAKLEADREGIAEERLNRLNARFRVACSGVDANVRVLCRLLKLRQLEIHLTTIAEPATWLDWELACILAQAQGTGPHTSEKETLPFTRSLDAARGFVAGVLPGFWVSSGLCALTGHASLGADYNGPDGERLRREWSLDAEDAVETWDEDIAPGDGPHRECMAILACAVRALAYRLEREASR